MIQALSAISSTSPLAKAGFNAIELLHIFHNDGGILAPVVFIISMSIVVVNHQKIQILLIQNLLETVPVSRT